MVVANATGCSSIYGGNLPTTPWTFNKDGRGPAWSNSLFEDNAEFGLGMRLTIDKQNEYARELLPQLAAVLGDELVKGLLEADQKDEAGIRAQRERVAQLKKKLEGSADPKAKDLLSIVDNLVKRSVWIMGGDGWAYDIGYGGLDHVLASGRNVNVLVLDTEVYSNTGGQASKSTPLAAVAKFASRGKALGKKDLALMAMSYGHVYVARVAFGANDQQTLKSILEAEAYDGPSLDPRLQPLHQPRDRHAQGTRPAEAGGAIRRLAAPALQPGAGRGGQESAGPRFEGSDHSAQRVRLQRNALPHARPERRSAGRAAHG